MVLAGIVWRDVWDESHAAGARGTIQNLLDLYFPATQVWTPQYLDEQGHGVDAAESLLRENILVCCCFFFNEIIPRTQRL